MSQTEQGGGRSGEESIRRRFDELLRALARKDAEFSLGSAELASLQEMVSTGAETSRSFAERLKARYGDGVDPQVDLDDDAVSQGGGLSSEVLERLSDRGPASMRYRLQGEIARGGMGAILRVWDEDLRRRLAMKVLHRGARAAEGPTPPPEEPRKLSRFLEEAQVTSQLDHPGIVPVHELGLDPEGRVYFTMKLVKGRTLRKVFDELDAGEGGWSQTRVLGLLLKVCEAMSYAHAKGVIHRDLKPDNIMVGRFGEVYVMDWGLAKVLGREDERDLRVHPPSSLDSMDVHSERSDHAGEAPDSPLYTMDGDVVGTPAYMPPEQATGRVSDMGPSSDVYGLGAMLYHLLAGHMPYVPKGARFNTYAVWNRVQEGPPRPLHELAPDAPAELVAICERAMSRETKDRYPDMLALADDLSAYVEGRVVRAYETGAWAEARKWVQRNKPLAASLAAAFVLMIAGLAASLYLRAEAISNYALAQEQREEAEHQERVATEQARLATARAEDVLRLSAMQSFEDLLGEARELWPPHPQNIRRYREWTARASELLAELPRHREQLAELGAPPAADEPVAVEASSPRGTAASERPADIEVRWSRNQLTRLIGGLERLTDPTAGLLTADGVSPQHGWSIPRRLAFAERLATAFAPGGDFESRWREALPEIAETHPGLDLRPQMGLVPIGRDPYSGLWEFWHVATGDEPLRDELGEIVRAENMGVVLVLLPAGTFWMGSQTDVPSGLNYDSNANLFELPVHEVELSAFFLSKYEMTQAQWLRLTGDNPSSLGPQGAWEADWGATGSDPDLLHPVEQVSWIDCMTWLPRVGLELPSEARWEYGCRAGTETPWWTGATKDSLQGAVNLVDRYANLAGAGYQFIEEWLDDGHMVHAPVGSYMPNAFGLHDVHGNLWEWCLDGYDGYFYFDSPRRDPVAPYEGARSHVERGGGFSGTSRNARSSARFDGPPASATVNLGVRPARSISR